MARHPKNSALTGGSVVSSGCGHARTRAKEPWIVSSSPPVGAPSFGPRPLRGGRRPSHDDVGAAAILSMYLATFTGALFCPQKLYRKCYIQFLFWALQIRMRRLASRVAQWMGNAPPKFPLRASPTERTPWQTHAVPMCATIIATLSQHRVVQQSHGQFQARSRRRPSWSNGRPRAWQ